MSAEDKPLILKDDALPGVDMSINNFELLASLQPAWTVVTKSMWKVKGQTFVGVKQFANEVGEVLEIGGLKKKYRIIAFIKREGTAFGKGGDIIRVKRADGNLTTNLDLENATKGQKVMVIGRQTFIEALDHVWGRDYVEPCKVPIPDSLPCQKENCE
jgi:hypothetical protein